MQTFNNPSAVHMHKYMQFSWFVDVVSAIKIAKMLLTTPTEEYEESAVLQK